MILKLTNKINNWETNCILQLYSWYAIEIIKKQFIKKRYYVDKCLERTIFDNLLRLSKALEKLK